MSLFNNKDNQLGQPKYISVGQIKGINVSGTMTGYVDGAALTIGTPAAGGVQAVGTIKASAGKITGITLTNNGAGYLTAPVITAPTGTGATLTASIAKNEIPNSQIVFVSYEESILPTNKLKGLSTPGWYRVQEKLKSDGQVTYKSECLVAMSVANATSGDTKGDDLIVGDVNISITTQPVTLKVTAPAAGVFTVVGTGITTYQWQIQTGGSGSYSDLSNGGVYSTVTTATLNISASTGLNGNRYRVVCGNGGTAQVISKGAVLTVTA